MAEKTAESSVGSCGKPIHSKNKDCDSHSDDDQDLLTDHEHNENDRSPTNESSQNPIPSEPRVF